LTRYHQRCGLPTITMTDSIETASIIISSDGLPASAISGTKIPNFEYYQRRLAPLVELEETLIRLLSFPDGGDEAVHIGPTPPTWEKHDSAATGTEMVGQTGDRPPRFIFLNINTLSQPRHLHQRVLHQKTLPANHQRKEWRCTLRQTGRRRFRSGGRRRVRRAHIWVRLRVGGRIQKTRCMH
jgi:hypothetical protein